MFFHTCGTMIGRSHHRPGHLDLQIKHALAATFGIAPTPNLSICPESNTDSG
jgi:hypothetical protein